MADVACMRNCISFIFLLYYTQADYGFIESRKCICSWVYTATGKSCVRQDIIIRCF
jgi:hypothetical protein